MVMERLKATLKHPGNQGLERQEAIIKAIILFKNAGVIDPGPVATSTGLRLIETVIVPPEGAIRFSIKTLAGQNLETVADSASGLMLGTEARRKIRTAPASKESRTRELIALDSRTMGLPDYPKTEKAFNEALRYGGKVTVEDAVNVAKGVAEKKIPLGVGKVLVMVMDTFADSGGDPSVLCVGRVRDVLWLNARCANPDSLWDPYYQFVVSSRK